MVDRVERRLHESLHESSCSRNSHASSRARQVTPQRSARCRWGPRSARPGPGHGGN
jgi:hypothetical protein